MCFEPNRTSSSWIVAGGRPTPSGWSLAFGLANRNAGIGQLALGHGKTLHGIRIPNSASSNSIKMDATGILGMDDVVELGHGCEKSAALQGRTPVNPTQDAGGGGPRQLFPRCGGAKISVAGAWTPAHLINVRTGLDALTPDKPTRRPHLRFPLPFCPVAAHSGHTSSPATTHPGRPTLFCTTHLRFPPAFSAQTHNSSHNSSPRSSPPCGRCVAPLLPWSPPCRKRSRILAKLPPSHSLARTTAPSSPPGEESS